MSAAYEWEATIYTNYLLFYCLSGLMLLITVYYAFESPLSCTVTKYSDGTVCRIKKWFISLFCVKFDFLSFLEPDVRDVHFCPLQESKKKKWENENICFLLPSRDSSYIPLTHNILS